MPMLNDVAQVVAVAPRSRAQRMRRAGASLLLLAIVAGVLVARRRGGEPPRPPALASDSWLAAPLRIIDPSTDVAEDLASGLRTAGYGVETYAPDGIDVDGPPSYWWVTASAAAILDRTVFDRLLATGSYILIDGATPLAKDVLGLHSTTRDARGATMYGTKAEWSGTVRAMQLTRHKGTRVIARTFDGDPALVSRGRLLWSLPTLSRSSDDLTRLPYLPQVLYRAWGMQPRLERRDVELYVDPDAEGNPRPEQLVDRWAVAGVRRVHLAAWKRNTLSGYTYPYAALVRAAHARGIVVYAWLAWPHVDFTFWKTYPKCRERTGVDQLAHIGWRQLVALEDPVCYKVAWAATKELLESAPFDGVHIAELTFESPFFGLREPGYLTPFHPWARNDFRRRTGVDPLLLLDPRSQHFWRKDAKITARWYAWREQLLTGIYRRLLLDLRTIPAGSKILVDVLDDRLDPAIGPLVRENSGLSTQRLLALRKEVPFELIVKDPYPFRRLDPLRAVTTYARAASAVVTGSPAPDALAQRELPAFGINAVPSAGLRDRQATRIPTGISLYGVIATAAQASDRTAIQSPVKLPRADLDWLRFALAGAVATIREDGDLVHTSSPRPFLLHLARRPARLHLDGKELPPASIVAVPAGEHEVDLG